MTNLLENRKSLHQQIVDSQMQFEAVEAQFQQLQPLANLGMAWAMTAHELNNLLTPIVSYAQLALQNPHDSELSQKALKKAERLSTQAGQMLEKVMTLANSDSAPKQVHALSALLDDVFGCIGRDFSKDKIKLVLEFDDALLIRPKKGDSGSWFSQFTILLGTFLRLKCVGSTALYSGSSSSMRFLGNDLP